MKGKEIKLFDESELFGETIGLLSNLEESLDSLLDVFDDSRNEIRKRQALLPKEVKRLFQKGDHIAVMRLCYTHHGIYDGKGKVYEYNEGKVIHRSLESFASGDLLYLICDSAKFTPDEIIRRAKSRLGEENYHLLWNNCVNFATWCRSGVPRE